MNFFNSTSFFVSGCQSIALYMERTVCFELTYILVSTSELGSWLARTSKIVFTSDLSRYSNSSFSKITALKPYIKFRYDAFNILHHSYTEEYLILLIRLAWILPSRCPSTFFFSQRWVFFKTYCCIFNLSFLRRFDRNYHNATSPLVVYSRIQLAG